MLEDIRFRITNYFDLSKEEREQVILDLSEFYYQKWISTENKEIFDFTINELLFRFELERKFALKSEDYHRVEIFTKLGRIFHQLKDKTEDLGM